MAATGMNNLTTLIKRLEAATSRLEDIASSAHDGPQDARSAAPSIKAPSVNGGAASSAPPAKIEIPEQTIELPETVQAFDTMMNDDLKPFADLCEKVGGLVAEQGAAFCVAFRAQRDVILIASQSKEPSPSAPVYMEILKDLQHGIETVNNVRENHRKVPEENHLSLLADGVAMLAWVTIKPNPSNYIAEVLGGAQFYGNKILTLNKDKDSSDHQWVRSFVKLSGALQAYVKENFAKGLTWNPSGVTPEQALKDIKVLSPTTSSSAALRASRGGAPPPPPPPLPQFDIPPPPPPPPASAPGAKSGSDMGAVFDQLNRGESVTSGLRKVDKNEMTHKNPALRAQAPVPNDPNSGRISPAPGRKPESLRAKKPPVKELEGNKWNIENFDNESSPIVIDAEKHHSILISRCKASTIRVNGKANAISIDNCSRLDLLIDSLVSSVSVVSSQNFRLQVLGSLPSVELDKVDGATVYLSAESLGTEVYTSKCTSTNITLPPAGDKDSVECPVPEQFRSWVQDGKLMTEIVKDA